MSQSLTDQLDFELAWKRIETDEKNADMFIIPPFLSELVRVDLSKWLERLMSIVEAGEYAPKDVVICDVLKPNYAIRPGAYLWIDDQLVYYACLGACLPHIYRAVSWPTKRIDHSYPLAEHFTNVEWFKSPFFAWKNFRTASIKQLDEGFSHVLITDIAGYYENIDIATLISDLRQIGAPNNVVGLLSSCLNRWAQVSGRGIPQGYNPSNLLGKLYLNTIDRILHDLGYIHLRYVDDIRVFCHSHQEAQRAFVDIIRLLRKKGLNIVSAKSGIYSADEARQEIDGVIPVLLKVRKNFMQQIIVRFDAASPYMSFQTARQLLQAHPSDEPVEVIRMAFEQHFIQANEDSFDKTLFHFLVNRLKEQKDTFALDYCKRMIKRRPEETSFILDYFQEISEVESVEGFLASHLQAQESVYPYQAYQILKWFAQSVKEMPAAVMKVARSLAFDNPEPFYLRSISRKLLGDHGTYADLERLLYSYENTASALEQSEIICNLHRMEKSKRNSFFGRAQKDGKLQGIAVRYAKSL